MSRSSIHIRLHAWTALGTALGLSFISTILVAGAASAEVVDAFTYDDSWGPDQYENFCDVAGLTVEVSGVASGRSKLVNHGPDGLGYFSDRARLTETYTNLATGESVFFIGHYEGHSLKVTDNGDGTLTVLTQNTGSIDLYDEAGHILARAKPGVFRFERQFYHMGTLTDPSDDVRFGDPVIAKNNGSLIDQCVEVVAAIG